MRPFRAQLLLVVVVVAGLLPSSRALAASISGGVRERTTNTPIAGATVQIKKGATTLTTTTNASGNYSFTGVAAGQWDLSAKKGCYQDWGPSVRTLGDPTGQNIIMEWYPRLTGGVRDNLTGAPIAGATVRLEGGPAIDPVVTNAAGVYTFSCIPVGNYSLVALKLGEYDNWSQGIALTSVSTTYSQNIAMTPKATIAGGVRDNVTDAPIPGATVRLEQGGVSKYETVSDGNGVYSLAGVTSGTYLLVGLKLGAYVNWSQSRALSPGEHATGANIAMTPTTARIAGVVRNALSAAPIGGATIRLEHTGQNPYTTVADGNGNYSFVGIPPNDYDLVALKLGEFVNWSQARNLNAGDNITDADIAMTPCASIAGGVRDGVTDDPLSGATVRLEQGGVVKYTFQYTGADGVYSITGVVPGTYNLVGLHLGDYTNWSQSKTLAAGQQMTEANIAMVPTFARIAGGVRNQMTLAPIAGATVRLEQAGNIVFTAVSSASGNYAFSSVPPGTYSLVGLKLGSYENWSQTRILAAADNETAANIAMTPLTTLSGHLASSADGATIAGAIVALLSNGNQMAEVVSDADGAFNFGAVNCISYSISIAATGFATKTQTVVPTCFTGNVVNVALDPQRQTLSVRVTSSSGTDVPVAGASVQWNSLAQVSGADGIARFGFVNCGSGVLTANAGGFGSYSSNLAVSCTATTAAEIVLSPGDASLSGVVTADEPGGTGIADALVDYGGMTATTSPSGAYTMSGLRCGAQILRVSATGFLPYEANAATLCAGSTVRQISLSRALAGIAGRVYTTNPGHTGVSGAAVQFGSYATVTDGSGLYSFSAVPCAGAILRITRPGFEKSERWFAPDCQATNSEDIALTPVGGKGLSTIVLVPGLCDRPSMWDEAETWLQGQGYAVIKANLGHNTGHPNLQAAELEKQLPRDGHPIHLVGYSMGGLIARDLVQQLAAKHDLRGIRSVTTFSTPHHGSDAAAWLQWAIKPANIILRLSKLEALTVVTLNCQAMSAALGDMVPGSAYLNKLNYGSSSSLYDKSGGKSWDAHRQEKLPAGPVYYTVAGTSGYCGLDRLLSTAWRGAPSGMRSDGVVSVPGQKLYGMAANWQDVELPVAPGNPAVSPTNHTKILLCPSSTLPLTPEAWKFVADLSSSVSSAPVQLASLGTAEEVASEIPDVELACPAGVVQPQDTTAVPLLVPPASQLDVMVSGAALRFELEEPTGTRLRPETIQGRPDVTYSENNEAGQRSYHIDGPLPGAWKVLVSGAPDGSAHEYVAGAFATTVSAPVLEVDHNEVHPSEPFQVSVWLDSATVALPLAGVRLDVLSADSVLASSVLRDDGSGGDALAGDGHYTGQFNAPVAGGDLSLYGVLDTGSALLVTRATVTVEAPENLRIVPASVQLDRAAVFIGDSVPVSFRIANDSGQELKAVAVELRDAYHSVGLADTLIDLGAFETRDMSLTWTVGSEDTVSLSVQISGTALRFETDYEDNASELLVIGGMPTVGIEATALPQRLAASALQLDRNNVAFHINAPNAGKVGIVVVDVAGRIIWKREVEVPESRTANVMWRMGDGARVVRRGIYFYRVTFGSERARGRVVMLR